MVVPDDVSDDILRDKSEGVRDGCGWGVVVIIAVQIKTMVN